MEELWGGVGVGDTLVCVRQAPCFLGCGATSTLTSLYPWIVFLITHITCDGKILTDLNTNTSLLNTSLRLIYIKYKPYLNRLKRKDRGDLTSITLQQTAQLSPGELQLRTCTRLGSAKRFFTLQQWSLAILPCKQSW